MRSEALSIWWVRRDFRLSDNPALTAAAKRDRVVPLYISEENDDPWRAGGASRWWLTASLKALDGRLREKDSRLIIRRGEAAEVFERLLKESAVELVTWNELTEPWERRQSERVQGVLENNGIRFESFVSHLLTDPDEVSTGQGEPYRVFTPFWKAIGESLDDGKPWPVPKTIDAPSRWPKSESIESEPDVARESEHWQPGEDGATRLLESFQRKGADAYLDRRDIPAIEGTSRLSPHLHFGEITPHRIRHRLLNSERNDPDRVTDGIIRQLAWRDFAHHLLHHYPKTPDAPLRPEFESMPYQPNRDALSAWQEGRTGYPIVDAAMRDLRATGWMHNRLRMIVASFLTKHLMQPWQDGAAWFWETLVDADLANNTLGWQWTAGCGADAAPYFRIFNPVLQGERFDPNGDYVKRWLPELGDLPAEWIHQPWSAPLAALSKAGIELGADYPEPMVDHAFARKRALAAYESMKSKSPKGARA